MIQILRDRRAIWLADHHDRYRETMTREFDYYHSAVASYPRFLNGEAVAIVDYSTPAKHHLPDFPDFPVATPSFLEPYSTVERYLALLDVTTRDVVWDIGAYVGMATLTFRRVGASVVSIEPDAQNLTCLLANLRTASCHATVLPVAVTAERGMVAFCADGTCGAALTAIRPQSTVSTIYGATLSDIEVMTGSVMPTVIKCDIEGAEVEVLRSSVGWLRRMRPRMVIESHRVNGQSNVPEIVDVLSSCGYESRTVSQGLHDSLLIVGTPS